LRQLVVKREDLARTLRDQLNQSGSNFAEIARDYSTNQTLKDQDGDLKLVFRYQIPQDVSEAIFSVQASEIVGPIAMTSGFHLFQIESIEAAELDDITAENIRSELFNDWLSQHLHDIKIDSQLLKLIPSY
jgi:foldase protein PrsA